MPFEKCPHCGKLNSIKLRSCPKCGKELHVAAATAPYYAGSPAQPQGAPAVPPPSTPFGQPQTAPAVPPPSTPFGQPQGYPCQQPSVPQGVFCQNCGTQLPAGARFCGNCGAPAAPPVQQPAMGQPYGQQQVTPPAGIPTRRNPYKR